MANTTENQRLVRKTKFSRLIIFDTIVIVFAAQVAVLLRYEFSVGLALWLLSLALGLMTAVFWIVAGFFTHLYRDRFVVGTLEEIVALVATAGIAAVASGAINVITGSLIEFARSAALIAAPISLVLAAGIRARLRALTTPNRVNSAGKLRAVVYGAGTTALRVVPQLKSDPGSEFFPVVLMDDSAQKSNRWIAGVPMGGAWEDFSQIVRDFNVEAVIVAIPSATSELIARVYLAASELGVKVVVLPTLEDYLRGSLTHPDLREVKIHDLLGRHPIQLDQGPVEALIRDRRVLITGAGGSIGSELARQVSRFAPNTLTLVDHDETGLVLTALGINRLAEEFQAETYLCDIRDESSVDDLFRYARPQVVFHAAALKHLAVLEKHPAEAWKTNVLGTLNVLRASQVSGVRVFINISTDKAANPGSVLGRSKKLGEELTAWFGASTRDTFVSVRFGNVLGSRGSLIPVLSDQIDSGGPVTVTDARATRYFMAISEACQLVLRSAAGGTGGDVMVLDMGEPVRIMDIANRMIELSGKKISVELIGLRPGEKLHEELFSGSEEPLPSDHPKITRFRSNVLNPDDLQAFQWQT